MKIETNTSFFQSVEKLVWYDTKLWKVWSAIRYDIPLFVKNVWRFRKELWNHQWWDYHFTLQMLHRSLVIMESKLQSGYEVPISRDKKVAKIRRAIQLLKSKIDDDYIDRAEAQLGSLAIYDLEFEPIGGDRYEVVDKMTKAERIHNTKVFKKAQQIEDAEWKELWEIFKGRDMKQFKKSGMLWDDWYDGSDMRGWWD